jgi:hypothetical protein
MESINGKERERSGGRILKWRRRRKEWASSGQKIDGKGEQENLRKGQRKGSED